ncbi:hypothetical protein [Paenarthrobacter nitroguajacolicus]|uniref:hypothetical protein n=1 Tax=Paenarthrobacter nitroguajacolicus TaxID=211146 RepID=UPI0015B7C0BE|nr:hypothetical protein [Paenarthrobacter nitroguajacolicus]NWL34460.1 hypothetical protein [Paenarthrobacter nitroguajacolicus]
MNSTLKSIALVLAILAGITLIGWAGWAISVAVSGPKGQGDAIKTKNSAENWTRAQAKFEELHQGIQSADKKAELAAERLKASPNDVTLQQQHAGVQSGCIGLVAEYNAESRKFLSEDFKSIDLPYQIDTTAPAFDCK